MNNVNTEKNAVLFNEYEKRIKVIDGRIDNLLTQNPSDYKQQREDIIKELDDVEADMMKNDWYGFNAYTNRLFLRESLYKSYKKLTFCAPNRSRRQFERKEGERYQNPIENLHREDVSKCAPELFVRFTYHVIKLSIIYINKADGDKLENKIKTEIKTAKAQAEIEYEIININDVIDINGVKDSLFTTTDYIIFIFPTVNQLKLRLLSQPKIEQMIGLIIRLNDTGKCIVLNKPKFKFFETMKFKFEDTNNQLAELFLSFLHNTQKIQPRNAQCRLIPWFAWINKTFQEYYNEHTDNFDDLKNVYVRSLPEERWMLTFIFEERSDVLIVKDDSSYKFGRPHRSKRRKLINEMKVYDKKMLRRVHRLREKLKYEIDPKIRRELRIKYKKLKKRID